ncbi:CBS domain-containing protein [Gilvimarinus sp. 1_MG-2023]|uniref:CBS domain-containing protein n=1 Tax=Gilvimarinus sp. 1_MG-2023 TaxID=3062638 RepID=UPI0026E45851|nr:CBS domain-containing protein [Gilvimarinus sp. 1_MG-2023]MDO6746214.1 CBS domain-containing protein [Gilvimarinus sp. 1_MG-2023]
MTAYIEKYLSPEVDCAYEGWSVQRLQNLLNRKELARMPVIASDHQLVGSVGSADIYQLMNQEETYRAQLVNDNFRRTTGHDVENLDELTQWARRALVYCTVHQIMQPAGNQIDISANESAVKQALQLTSQQTLWVTRQGILIGQITAAKLLA